MTKYDDYGQTIIRFNRSLYSNGYAGDRGELFFAVAELLYNLLEHLLAESSAGTVWKTGECRDLGHVISIDAYEEAAEIDLHLGINKDGIYLEMNVTNTENVSGLPDEVWQQFIALSDICRVDNPALPGQTGTDLFSVGWPFEIYSIVEVFNNSPEAFNRLLNIHTRLKHAD